MEIITKRIKDIKPYEKNPRKNDAAVEYVANSIREFGFKVPIVIDKDGTIVCGHTRWKAAKKLGMKEVPCIMADDLSPEQIKAFRLADNKVGELAEWDFDFLKEELEDIGEGFDMEDFGFLDDDWFSRKEKDGAARQEGNNEYNEFLDKFEDKKTTDDCYTPDNIYNAVAAWVEKEYGVNQKDFVRPFYPGGDYARYKYPEGCVVCDNPPFSILSEITKFYMEHGIRFFLFAPALTIFNSSSSSFCSICCNVSITYENGAKVSTSFVTNMDEALVKSCPELYHIVKDEDEKNTKSNRELPSYVYPDEVVTSAIVGYLSKYGVTWEARKSDAYFIRCLDEQKEAGKTLFGSGFLLSEKAAAEKAAREKVEAIMWHLSAREREIVKSLGGSHDA